MQWIPCDIQYTGDPALDLGDWVTYTGYTAGDGIEVPIHKIDWKYRGWQRLETLDINRKSERENNANRARQEELATIIKSGVGARSIGEHAEIFMIMKIILLVEIILMHQEETQQPVGIMQSQWVAMPQQAELSLLLWAGYVIIHRLSAGIPLL